MTAFRDAMHADQMAWKARRLPGEHQPGRWQGRQYDHICPRRSAAGTMWSVPLLPLLPATASWSRA